MDPYSLKRDNRKKFQDKQRLKHRHATPSDRKYRALKYQESQTEKEGEKDSDNESEEELKPPSNEYRYHEDVTMAFEDPAEAERDRKADRKIREVLRSKETQGEPLVVSTPAKEAVTTKSLHSMALDSLNDMLGSRFDSPKGEISEPARITGNKPIKKASTASEKTKPAPSLLPDELQSAQDFLDDLI